MALKNVICLRKYASNNNNKKLVMNIWSRPCIKVRDSLYLTTCACGFFLPILAWSAKMEFVVLVRIKKKRGLFVALLAPFTIEI